MCLLRGGIPAGQRLMSSDRALLLPWRVGGVLALCNSVGVACGVWLSGFRASVCIYIACTAPTWRWCVVHCINVLLVTPTSQQNILMYVTPSSNTRYNCTACHGRHDKGRMPAGPLLGMLLQHEVGMHAQGSSTHCAMVAWLVQALRGSSRT